MITLEEHEGQQDKQEDPLDGVVDLLLDGAERDKGANLPAEFRGLFLRRNVPECLLRRVQETGKMGIVPYLDIIVQRQPKDIVFCFLNKVGKGKIDMPGLAYGIFRRWRQGSVCAGMLEGPTR